MKSEHPLHISIFVAVIVICLSVLPKLANADTKNIKDPLIKQLVNIAQNKLDNEYDTLVSGDAKTLTPDHLNLVGNAAEKEKEISDTQVRRNKGLAEHGQKYTKYFSDLTVEKTEVVGNEATITAREHVTLTLNANGVKNPINTEEIRTHAFHFVQQNGVWVLSEDKNLDELKPAVPDKDEKPVDKSPLKLTSSKNIPSRDKFSDPNNRLSFLIKPAFAISGTYNPTNAVNYAYNYWGPNESNYNSAYRHWTSDCTNFVSQALNWGGWQHVAGFYQDPHYWWYDPSGIQTYSWVGTNHFYWFARYSGRAYGAQYLSDFRPGDVLQMDQSVPDGILEHTEIVTSKDSNGDIYLTSHSVNVKNKSFWDIYYQWPGAAFYGTIMYYQY